MRGWIVALALVTSSASAPAELVTITPGYLTGNQYLRYSDHERLAYLMGVVDGMLIAPGFSAPKSKTAWLENCYVGKDNTQVWAMVERWMQANPSLWNQRMHTLIWRALGETCATK